MAESYDLERRLGRLFDETPVFADDRLFAARVQNRLETKDGVRRAVMGLVGGAGAFVAVLQLVGSNFTLEVARASQASTAAVEQGWDGLTRDAAALVAGAPLQGEVMWTVAALGALALTFLATRMADRF